ncbi:MAG: OmpA family protein, partial [Myxococcota bacterium]|nr:OmpA family protein [Myxococcota bacterium]
EPPPPPKKRVRLAGKRIEFDGKVMFDTGSSSVLAASNALLDEMASVLIHNPLVTLVEVQGHTDARGTRSDNVELSQARAEAVVAYLVAQGIDATRLQAKGFGPDVPRMDGDDETSWAANRRVELHILEQTNPAIIPVLPAEPSAPEAVDGNGPGDGTPATRAAQSSDKGATEKDADE